MLRGIAKLMLLLILVLMATGFPIYFDRIDAESFWERASNRIDEPEEQEVSDTIHFQHDLERQSEDSFILHMSIENLGEAVVFQDDFVEFTVSHGEQQLNTLNLNDFNVDIPFGQTIARDEIIDFSVEFDRRSLDYPYESYTLALELRDDLTTINPEEMDLAFSFEENFTYVPAIFEIPESETALTLYFPTDMPDYSVPVTRIISYTPMQIRATVDGLFDGPHEDLGLSIPEEGIMPPWQNLAYDNGLATINLNGDLEIFGEDPDLGQQAYRAYAYSVNATSFTNRVQFTFDRGVREEAFGGIPVEDPVTLPQGPIMYFGYETDTGRLLLTPKYLEQDPTFAENQNYYNENNELEDPEGFYRLFTLEGNPDFYDQRHQPLIPYSVSLNNLNLESKVLELAFEEDFLTEISEDAQQALLDSLLISFTSFSNVDSVVFNIVNYDQDALYRYPLGTPMAAPNHINPEVPRDETR